MKTTNITAEERRDLIEAIHANAVAKGFWAEDHSEDHYLMLAITELSEAVEAHRDENWARRDTYQEDLLKTAIDFNTSLFRTRIKDSVEDELADAVIRLYDIIGAYEYKIMEEKISHWRKEMLWVIEQYHLDEFTTQIIHCVSPITHNDITAAIGAIEAVAEYNGIDLYWHVREKMKYNSTRPPLHGKKY